MLLEGLLNILTAPFFGMLDLLPSVDTSFLENWAYVSGVLKDILTGIGCIIPVSSLFPILYCQLSIWSFRLILAIVVRIKSFIPTLGGT